MPNRTFVYLTLLSIVGLLAFQLGCDRTESARRDAAAKNLKAVGDALDAYEAKLNAEASSVSSAATPNQDTVDGDDSADSDSQSDQAEKEPAEPTIEITDNWTRLNEDHEVWIDKKAKQVMFGGRICLNAGQLEMFICPEGTKEHEAVIAASVLSSKIHFALLLIDCQPGKTSSWDPVYRPAHGPTIEATIKWRDEKSGKTKSQDAKQWIRDVDTKKAMTQRWIFGGSGFWKDPDTGDEIYFGDSGELLCLSNFSTATIDVDVKSSQANAGLLFEAFTENIPPVGTKVYTILTPGEVIKPEVKPEQQTVESKETQDADDTESEIGEVAETGATQGESTTKPEILEVDSPLDAK